MENDMENDLKSNPEQTAWEKLSYAEKNRALFERQKALLDLFLSKHAISKAQYEKSLSDLKSKMRL